MISLVLERLVHDLDVLVMLMVPWW